MITLTKLFTNLTIVAASIGIAACSTVGNTGSELTNKEKAVAVISSMETGDQTAVSYINPTKYTQHNLAVADGLAGFGAVLQALPKGSAKAQVKRAFQDGEYVIAHTEYNFFGPKAGFDVFRFEDGKIVEHWDNLQELSATKNPSGHTQLDGATKIVDIDKTQQNKALIADFVKTILADGDLAQINRFISNEKGSFIQHNPAVADDLSGLGKALTDLANAGMPMVYSANHKILGEGNFVLSISEGQFLNKHVAFYDLFRVENDKIVEHWDTIESIPAKSDWKNSNGKFGFSH